MRTPFTLIETSTLDDTWNTSVTFSFSTNYKEYKIVEVRTSNCKEELHVRTRQLYSIMGAPPNESKEPSPVKCSQTNVRCMHGFEGQLVTIDSSLYAWRCETNR